MIRTLDVPSPAGPIDCRIVTPERGGGALGPVILFPDIGGVRQSYEDKAQTIADGGYAVLLPNIYYRSARAPLVPAGKSFRDPEVRTHLRSCADLLTPDALNADFAALIGVLDREPEFAAGPAAAVGYCMTGAFALRIAAAFPDRIAAAAAFHSANLAPEGDPAQLLGLLPSIRARLYFGHADQDALLPPDQIGRLDTALAAAGVHFATELYRGALHGFTANDAPSYDPAADALHMKRLFTLLDETLGAG